MKTENPSKEQIAANLEFLKGNEAASAAMIAEQGQTATLEERYSAINASILSNATDEEVLTALTELYRDALTAGNIQLAQKADTDIKALQSGTGEAPETPKAETVPAAGETKPQTAPAATTGEGWGAVGNDDGDFWKFEDFGPLIGMFIGVGKVILPGTKKETKTWAFSNDLGTWLVPQWYSLKQLENEDDITAYLYRITYMGAKEMANGGKFHMTRVQRQKIGA